MGLNSACLAAWLIIRGIVVAGALGWAGGWVLSEAFRRAYVPEYMKVPVLFVVLLAVFAISDSILHESGLLTVTIMGLWIANAGLPSYVELRRFKEHATVLLVSGVFILLAANMSADGGIQCRTVAFFFQRLADGGGRDIQKGTFEH